MTCWKLVFHPRQCEFHVEDPLNYSEDLTGAAVLIPSCPTRVQLATSQETLVEQIILVGLWKAMNVE
jgi:hypothetical protein